MNHFEACKMAGQYKKRDGANAIEGHWFEIKLILLITICALINDFKFKLASNIDEAGAFDDIVCNFEFLDEFEYTKRRTLYIQAKHITNPENNKITKDELIKNAKNKQGKFMLKKYFESYLIIQSNKDIFNPLGFDVSNADYVILTNTSIHENFLHYFKPVVSKRPISGLFKSNNCITYKISEDYYEEFCPHLQGEEQDKIQFLANLTFLVSQENQQGVETLIKEHICQKFDEHNISDINYCFSKANEYVQKWWVQSGSVEFLTDNQDYFKDGAKHMVQFKIKKIEEMLRNEIKERYIKFTETYIESFYNKIHPHQFNEIVTAEGAALLSLAKIFQRNKDLIYVDDGVLQNFQSEVFTNFEQSAIQNLLVLKVVGNSQEFISRIETILVKNKEKRLIVLSEKHPKITSSTKLNIIDDSVADSFNMSDLTDVCMDNIRGSEILVNGKRVKIMNVFTEHTTRNLNMTIISPLLLGKEINISHCANNIDIDVWNYYIPRTFTQNIYVNIREMKMCKTDYFFIIGSSIELEENPYFKAYHHYPNHSGEFENIYLHTNKMNAEVEFTSLCSKYSKSNVHMLHFVRKKCCWVKTSGLMTNILKLIDVRSQECERYSEKDLVRRCNNDKIALISDVAGMGKTIVLKKLARDISELFPTFWVQVIDLNQCKLKFHPPNVSEDTIGILLQILNIEDQLTRALFVAMYNAGNVALIFDGFDECEQEYETELAKFLSKLKLSPIKQIYITCRTNKREYLEITLGTIAYRFNILEVSEQVQFLVKVWLNSEQNKQIVEELPTLSRRFITKMNSIRTDHDIPFCGVPLQLRMLAEIYSTPNAEVQDICKTECPGKIPNSLSEIYYLLIDKKIALTFHEKLSLPKGESLFDKDENIVKVHELLALHVLFSQSELSLILTSAEQKKLQAIINSKFKYVYCYGLLADVENCNLRFVHHTIVEYFVASYISKKQTYKQSKDYNNFLVRTILIEEKFKIVRKFLNGMVNNSKFPLSEVQNFPFKLITKSINFPFNLRPTSLHMAAAENNEQLVQLIIGAITKVKQVKHLVKCTDQNYKTALHHAAENGNLEIVQYLHTRGSSLGTVDCNGRSVLDSSAFSGNWKLFMWLYENGVDFSCLRQNCSVYLTMARFSGSVQVVEWLISKGVDDTYVENSGDTPLHEVARGENLELVEWYLARGADINAKNKRGNTILLEAAIDNRLHIVKYMLEKNADVNISNKVGDSFLHIMCERNLNVEWHELVEQYLKAGANINLKNLSDENTALHIAVMAENTEMINLLVQYHANINALNSKGETPLYHALLSKNFQISRFLIENGANVNRTDDSDISILHKVSEDGDFATAIWLLSHGADINERNKFGETLLSNAAKYGDLEFLKLLKKKGADMNVRYNFGNSIACIACQYGKLTIIQWLQANVNDKNLAGDTLLMNAVKFGKINVALWLLENNASINGKNMQGDSALSIAAQIRNLDLLKKIVEKEANIKEVNSKGDSVLHLAAMKGCVELCKWCLDQGVEIDLQNRSGYTALMLASKHGNSQAVRMLTLHGACISTRNKFGNTALHEAALSNNYDIVIWLVEKGMDINGKNNVLDTVLLIVAKRGRTKDVISLLEYGADISARNRFGNTALHIAVLQRDLEMVESLADHGADINAVNNAGYSSMMIAVEISELNIFKTLLYREADIFIKNNAGETCLFLAARGGLFHELDLLLKYGANVNSTNNIGDSVLNVAIRSESNIIISWLFLKNASIDVRNNFGTTALCISARLGDLKLVKKLVSKGADVTNVDIFGNTVLHHAASSYAVNLSCKDYPKENIITYLFKYGADIRVKNNDNHSVLDIANQYGHNDVILMLHEYSLLFRDKYVSKFIDDYLLLRMK